MASLTAPLALPAMLEAAPEAWPASSEALPLTSPGMASEAWEAALLAASLALEARSEGEEALVMLEAVSLIFEATLAGGENVSM